ncbi:bifunctional transcriptional activator/DNA repair enzyme AdaA [Saccharibacillus alkalitolerans]|uniref:Methylphosphotriester-DNA--protein-cysteine methyltransferase family protein n=1 Tax=Saccharibacillus alkalitolerans TaxID=2705290 RepID=A0ABX0FAV7_9BACL|nr:Ada metal-binding domain-containing protein [Saccharibacillus alkalitolerans]NGZ77094.1 methylphosphotriester-DNA--protein-cysteine methyltransferase family protein [Saccharibacillus alkalitolerans]
MSRKIQLSFEEMWARIMACDARYDGLFFTAVKTTRIYCRPSCRSRKPKKVNVEFYALRSEAVKAGYRPCKRCQPQVEHSPWNEFVLRAREFIVANHRKNLLLKHIADHVQLSAYYLERLFKQETGETPRLYLEKVRVDRAAYLLRCSERANLDICYEAGFHTPSNFYKAFRRHHGCSPGEYRSQGAPIVREALRRSPPSRSVQPESEKGR